MMIDSSVTGSVVTLLGTTHHIRIQNATIASGSGAAGGGGAFGNIYTRVDGTELINLDISGTKGAYGIYIDGGIGSLVEGCDIHHVAFMGIHPFSDDRPPPSNYIIRNNTIRDITTSTFFGKPDTRIYGIIASGTNGQIYNNLIYGLGMVGGSSSNAGIVAYVPKGLKIFNNTVTGNGASVGGIRVNADAQNVEVRNNISYANAQPNYTNLSYSTQESNNLFGVDPLFVNPSGKDFQLRAASPAVDAGSSLSVVASDLVGVARPQGSRPDIGAYEFRGQAAAPGPPAPPTGVRIVSN
jgi:hypothetical protein